MSSTCIQNSLLNVARDNSDGYYGYYLLDGADTTNLIVNKYNKADFCTTTYVFEKDCIVDRSVDLQTNAIAFTLFLSVITYSIIRTFSK